MPESLFRPAATAACEQALGGAPLPGLPLPLRLTVGAVTALAAGVVSLLLCGEYARKTTVRGYVTTTEADVRVFVSAAGVVTELFVAEGERVAPGQPLVAVSRAPGHRGPLSGVDELLDSIEHELAAMDRRISASESLYNARAETLDAEKRAVTARRHSLERRLAGARQRVELTQHHYERLRRSAAGGYVPAAELERAERDRLGDEQDLDALGAEIRAADAALELIVRQLSELASEHKLALSGLVSLRRQIETRLRDAAEQRSEVVRAPLAGRVSALSVRVGQRSLPEKPILRIVPAAARYEVRLLLTGRSLGFVTDGSSVSIRYEAFPWRKFGMHSGRIRSIAASYLLPHEIDAPLPVREAVFPADVTLAEQSLAFRDRRIPLNAGMLVEADIAQESRLLAEWLMEPALALLRRR